VAVEEALYVVEFGDMAASGTYRNGGVIVLETGRVYGGDSGYYYVGTYSVKDGQLTGEVKVVKHNLNVPYRMVRQRARVHGRVGGTGLAY
jgi:T3SS negative regulator,GrlR